MPSGDGRVEAGAAGRELPACDTGPGGRLVWSIHELIGMFRPGGPRAGPGPDRVFQASPRAG